MLCAQPVLVRSHLLPILPAFVGWNGLQGRMLMSLMFRVMREVVPVGDKNRASLDGQNGGQDKNYSLQELDSHAIPSLQPETGGYKRESGNRLPFSPRLPQEKGSFRWLGFNLGPLFRLRPGSLNSKGLLNRRAE